MTKNEQAREKLSALLRARVTLIYVISTEEARVEEQIEAAAKGAGYKVRAWDCGDGLQEKVEKTDEQGRPYVDVDIIDPSGDPQAPLAAITDTAGKMLLILRDLHAWADPITVRKLKNAAQEIQGAPSSQAKTIVVLTHKSEIPPELSDLATVIDWPLPERGELAEILDGAVGVLKGEAGEKIRAGLVNGAREAAIDAATGLTGNGAGNAYAMSLVMKKNIEAAHVSEEKKRVVSREKVLTVSDPDPRGLEAIGGLEYLKSWLTERKGFLGQDARDFGLKAPKGVLLLGHPGTGKSLTAKAVAAAWGLPLLKLDLGALKSKYVGECHADDTEFLTERGMRRFDEIGEDDRLATFNIATGALEYQRPTQRHEYEYTGPMCLVPGRGLLVTPNHRMVARRKTALGHTAWYLSEAEQIFNLSNVQIPVAPDSVLESAPETITVPGQVVRHGRGEAVTLPVEEMLELLGYFVADGSTNDLGGRGTVRITQQEGPLADRMLYLLGKFGPSNAHGRDDRSVPPVRQIHVQSIPLWCYFREQCGIGHVNKRLPNWVLRASKPQLEILWKALMSTDGSRDARGYPSMSYSTTSAVLAEQVQEIAFRLGMRVTFRETHPAAPRKPLFIVSVTPKNYFQPHVDWIDYTGRVVCFTVPNGTLVTRREGRWAISGNSEGNIRKALAVAEAVSPCVVWLDEIEKALAGATGPQGDGGVSSDALGTILTWMQERQGSVFVVATANDVRALPDALLRKGRFDEMFFVDLPTSKERREILAASLRERRRDPEQVGDLDLAVAHTKDFTGAEIAACVESALGLAFVEGKRDLTIADIITAAASVVPSAKTSAEGIDGLRKWAKGRARPASLPEGASSTTNSGRDLDLE